MKSCSLDKAEAVYNFKYFYILLDSKAAAESLILIVLKTVYIILSLLSSNFSMNACFYN